MSQLFVKVVKEALKTFDRSNLAAFTSNLANLKDLTNSLTIEDIGLDFALLKEQISRASDENNCPTSPCTYVHIFENDFLSLSVFVLKKDYQMPLHDHPLMHGILKPLAGKLLIQSFTRVFSSDKAPIYDPNDLSHIPVKIEDPLTVDGSSECVILTPVERNFHEIRAVGEVGAFFDILSPPYESKLPEFGDRACNFFRGSLVNNGRTFLEAIPAPSSYHCNKGRYARPEFLTALDQIHTGMSS